nr:demethoxyubiquinone hydroxylase family protein [uncultured Pseudomonas sp.]
MKSLAYLLAVTARCRLKHKDRPNDHAPRTRHLNVNSPDYTAEGEGLGNRMMKVDHAGEHGAICIYSGQLFMARLFVPGMVNELKEFLSHERRHRTVFQEELQRRNYPRCRSYWLCGIGGLALGLATGICGRKAIVATTVAVESVVLKHLAHQLDVLGDIDLHAVAAITSIVEEEQHHHDHSAAQIDVRDPWFRVLTPMVTAWTEAVIWMGMRS